MLQSPRVVAVIGEFEPAGMGADRLGLLRGSCSIKAAQGRYSSSTDATNAGELTAAGWPGHGVRKPIQRFWKRPCGGAMVSMVSPAATVIAVPPSQLQLPDEPGLRSTDPVTSEAPERPGPGTRCHLRKSSRHVVVKNPPTVKREAER